MSHSEKRNYFLIDSDQKMIYGNLLEFKFFKIYCMLNIEYVYWWEITLYRFFIIFWICKDDNMYLIYVLSCGSLDVVFEFCMLKNKR